MQNDECEALSTFRIHHSAFCIGDFPMTLDKLLVTLGGLAAIALIVWFFWLVKKPGVKAGLSSSGYQEAMVLVKGGYTPDVIVVQRGKPVRLNFVRAESAS